MLRLKCGENLLSKRACKLLLCLLSVRLLSSIWLDSLAVFPFFLFQGLRVSQGLSGR